MAVNFVSALGAGSGIDTKKLAEELVAIERAPRQAQIDKRTAAAESRISGYGVVRFALSELKNAFAGLNDLSEFASVTARSSQPSAVGVSAGATAATGSLDVTVKAVATAQRITSAGYAESTTPLNRGAAFSLELTDAGGKTQSIAIAAADTSPAGIVRTINADRTLGITAPLNHIGGKAPDPQPRSASRRMSSTWISVGDSHCTNSAPQRCSCACNAASTWAGVPPRLCSSGTSTSSRSLYSRTAGKRHGIQASTAVRTTELPCTRAKVVWTFRCCWSHPMARCQCSLSSQTSVATSVHSMMQKAGRSLQQALCQKTTPSTSTALALWRRTSNLQRPLAGSHKHTWSHTARAITQIRSSILDAGRLSRDGRTTGSSTSPRPMPLMCAVAASRTLGSQALSLIHL